MKLLISILFVAFSHIYGAEIPSSALAQPPQTPADVCRKSSEDLGKAIINDGLWHHEWSDDIFSFYSQFLTQKTNEVRDKVIDGYSNIINKYPKSLETHRILANHQNVLRETITSIVSEEELMLHQKLARLEKLSESKFATAIVNLRELNDEYARSCDSYNEYFEELQADHVDLQEQLNALLTEGDVEAAVSAHNGRSRIHPIDFTLNSDIEDIFKTMSATKTPLENFRSGWKQVAERLYEKIAESQLIVREAEEAARSRLASRSDWSIEQQKHVSDNINKAIKTYDSVILERKEKFAIAQKESEDEFEGLPENDVNSVVSIYKPNEMQDSRHAYVANGIRINDATSDAVFALEKSLDLKVF